MIWLVEWGKVIVLHVRHALWCNLWRSLPEDVVKFWRQRKPAAIMFHYLPFHKSHSCQINKSALHLFRITRQTWNNRKTVNPTQSSILMCRFRCSNRRRFLNSLLISGKNKTASKPWRTFSASCVSSEMHGIHEFCSPSYVLPNSVAAFWQRY